MKTISGHIVVTLMVLALAATGCGGKGGTETGTSDPTDVKTLSARIETVGSALVLSMDDAGESDASAGKAIDYRSSEDWEIYLEEPNPFFLTDIFGPADTSNASESRVRVVLREYQTMIDFVFSGDPSLLCQGGTFLNEGDTMQIPFYGTISNGSAVDRYFQCLRDGSEQKMLYGQDGAGVLRLVYMIDATDEVDPGGYPGLGNANRQRFVIQSSYAETTEGGVTNAFLDLQYAKTLHYNGEDTEFNTADDPIAMFRSRVTGNVALDAAGAATVANGDFTVIGFNEGTGDDGQWLTTHVDAIGRGNATAGGHLLFNIDIHSDSPLVVPGIYCLTGESDGTPAYSDPANCSSYENAVPWPDDAFPFILSPAIDELFESKAFYQANDTDLISTTGSNFTIPEYQTSALLSE